LAISGLLLAGCGGDIEMTECTSETLTTPQLHVGPVQFMIPAGFTRSTHVATDSRYAGVAAWLNRDFARCEHATEEVAIVMMPGYTVDLARGFVEAMRDDYEDVVVHRREARSINDVDVDLLDYEGTESKGRVRLIACVVPNGDGAHILFFGCPAADAAAWLPTAERVMSSIHLRGQASARPRDGDGRGE
jgi:hypothetical protein